MLWSLLSGAWAYTYGAWQVFKWCRGSFEKCDLDCCNGEDIPQQTWKEQLDLSGACQIKHIINFFNSIPWWELEPDEHLIKEQDKDPLKYIAAARSENIMVIYAPDNNNISIDIVKCEMIDSKLGYVPQCSWYRPRHR